MTPFLLYQIKAGICIMLFTGLYYLLFRKETFHRGNRIYLIASVILSAVLPIIQLPDIATGSTPTLTQFISTVTVIAASTAQAGATGSGTSILTLVYQIVDTLVVIHLLFQLGRLFMLLIKRGSIQLGNYRIVTLPQKTQSFSFFHFIFISSASVQSGENDQILQHEITHARQWHSFDILLIQFVKIFQWFNPFIYLTEKALIETHEYLADEAVMEQNGESGSYKLLLLTRVFGVQPGIFSLFNYSIIKNRLTMMTKEKSPKLNRLKYLAVLPLVILMGLILSSTVVKSQDPESKKTEVSKPEAIEIIAGSKTEIVIEEEPSFIFVEETALFQGGGLEDFREWVQKNLVYPPVAVQNGIFGRITVQFAINSKGKICDVKILRGVDPSLDQEAIRVLNLSPEWKPAKQGGRSVKQQFVMPVIFQLQ